MIFPKESLWWGDQDVKVLKHATGIAQDKENKISSKGTNTWVKSQQAKALAKIMSVLSDANYGPGSGPIMQLVVPITLTLYVFKPRN